MSGINLDIKVGLVIIFFLIFLSLIVVPNQIDTDTVAGSSPAIYPQILIWTIIFSSIIMIISSIKKRKLVVKESESKTAPLKSRDDIRVYITISASFIYIWFLVEWLGFLLSSTIMLMFFIRFYGYTKKLNTVLISVLAPIIVYYIFAVRLHMPLPVLTIFQ